MLARSSFINRLSAEAGGANSPRFLLFSALTACILISVWTVALKATRHSGLFASSPEWLNEDRLDQQLQTAATAALGDRLGAVIVMDPQTGRVRAIVNSQLAFEETFRPGSTIKPFTALAALRSGVIDEDTRTLCREKYSHEDFHTTCAHPRELSPLNPTEAIAYSCNYYFGKVGERLDERSFNSTLNEFGFGKQTGVNAGREAAGVLLHNEWHSQNAIGEGDYLQATPIQLLNAYAALVNGGHLFTPQISSARDFVPELQASISIKDEHRRLIVKGMRGAVRYGTAESASLYSLPMYVFGKTGTATQIGGFRTQGWFVGFASDTDESAKGDAELAPEKVKLAVLVFLTKAHGSEAAQIARPIFAAGVRASATENAIAKQQEIELSNAGVARNLTATSSPGVAAAPALVRVHLVRENITRQLSLEDYVRGVVAAEGSIESEPEALKALAIASRTYALKNIGRHAHDGYDFCTTTHCQRFRLLDSNSTRDVSSAVAEAVDATRGEVLRDTNNQLVDAYFSASCGGATANIGSVWGGNAPPYLRGVRDEYCAGEAHHSWTDVISEKQLLAALKSDPRTDVGDHLAGLSVLRRDASGRAELITIEGERRLTVRGWDFKIIVGRALGWNYLKSSRFEIARSGSNFVFRGSGFGHGLGLCQEGAHVMATRGASYRQILAKYFPSTEITNADRHPTSADLMWRGEPHMFSAKIDHSASQRASPARAFRQTLRSEDFRISYPGHIPEREIETLLNTLQASRRSLIGRAAAAGFTVQFPVLEIFINETTGDFVGHTGQPAWAAAATKGTRIELQPLETLKRRRILETTLRHELVHAFVDALGHGRAPRWLAEGLALYFAGEGQLVARYQPRQRLTLEQIEKQLAEANPANSPNEMRTAYAAAYNEVKRLIETEGETNVWRRVAK
ncbi:MAG TPA: hypothetical protein DCK93_07430 [Blastocatellia bacterium]|nr:hypothetical protein [Blastocatellia bacterium]HAF22734.1 hypothetical protein [Blastocatellia bacterium]